MTNPAGLNATITMARPSKKGQTPKNMPAIKLSWVTVAAGVAGAAIIGALIATLLK